MIAPYDPKRDSEPRETPRSLGPSDPVVRDVASFLRAIAIVLALEALAIGAIVWHFWGH